MSGVVPYAYAQSVDVSADDLAQRIEQLLNENVDSHWILRTVKVDGCSLEIATVDTLPGYKYLSGDVVRLPDLGKDPEQLLFIPSEDLSSQRGFESGPAMSCFYRPEVIEAVRPQTFALLEEKTELTKTSPPKDMLDAIWRLVTLAPKPLNEIEIA